jgi:hypothetical protein
MPTVDASEHLKRLLARFCPERAEEILEEDALFVFSASFRLVPSGSNRIPVLMIDHLRQWSVEIASKLAFKLLENRKAQTGLEAIRPKIAALAKGEACNDQNEQKATSALFLSYDRTASELEALTARYEALHAQILALGAQTLPTIEELGAAMQTASELMMGDDVTVVVVSGEAPVYGTHPPNGRCISLDVEEEAVVAETLSSCFINASKQQAKALAAKAPEAKSAPEAKAAPEAKSAPETKKVAAPGLHTECANCTAPKNLKGNALLPCSRCKLVAYCGEACQRQHWRAHHKLFCIAVEDRKPKKD